MLDLRLYILKNKVKPQNYSQTSSDDFRNINCNPNHFSLFQCTSLSWIKLWTWVSFIFVVLIGIECRLANLTLLSWGDVFSCLGFHIHYEALKFKHMRALFSNLLRAHEHNSLAVFKIETLIWVSFWRAIEFQPFNWRASSNPRRQYKNIEMKYKSHSKRVHEFYGTCFQCNVKN